MPLIDERRETKARHERYRTAARRLYPGVTFTDHCTVNESASKDGAFLEGTVWITDTQRESSGTYTWHVTFVYSVLELPILMAGDLRVYLKTQRRQIKGRTKAAKMQREKLTRFIDVLDVPPKEITG